MSAGGLEFAGIGLAIPGLIDLCIKYGDFLRSKISNYKHMRELSRVYELVTSLVEGEMSDLLHFLKNIEHKLPAPTRIDLLRLFQVLRDRLELVKTILPEDKAGVLDKLKFSFRDKKLLDRACEDLEQWQTRFLRRAVTYLFFGDLSISNKTDESARQDRVIERVKRIRAAITSEDAVTATVTLKLEDFADSTTFEDVSGTKFVVADKKELVEYRRYVGSMVSGQVKHLLLTVRELATRLHNVDPAVMGLLNCTGFSNDIIGHRLALRFHYPTGQDNPRSLEQLLADKQPPKHSISDRIALASKVASAILYLHSCGFVHKNIRPSNILIFDDAVPDDKRTKYMTHPYAIGEPYLMGFDGVRKADAKSNMIRGEEWRENIYLHPDRHRMAEGDEFTMAHDVYSLGVVLLEIALWASVTESEPVGKYLWEKGKQKILEPETLRKTYIDLSKSLVPRYVGDKYRDVVVSCLEGLRDEEENGQLADQDDIIVGSAYISQVMSKLEEISM
jgi:hypothetical protein